MPLVDSEVRRHAGEAPGATVDRDWLSWPPPPADGHGGWRPDPGWDPPVSSGCLGVWMLLAAETAFFGGLVAAYLALRSTAPVWPPLSQPRLPVGVTALNTLALLGSSVALVSALRAARRADRRRLVRRLAGTAGLGALFLVLQGTEWVRLVGFGLTVSSGAYGGAFYTLIGVHAVHVLGALIWLTLVLAAAVRKHDALRDHEGLALCAMYWHFVVAVWPILYILVYLA